ncbi:hypothetical protein ES703_63959 [subsurface metagenome]
MPWSNPARGSEVNETKQNQDYFFSIAGDRYPVGEGNLITKEK